MARKMESIITLSNAFFLYQGKERLKRDGIHCLPCEEFLRSIRYEAPRSLLRGASFSEMKNFNRRKQREQRPKRSFLLPPLPPVQKLMKSQ